MEVPQLQWPWLSRPCGKSGRAEAAAEESQTETETELMWCTRRKPQPDPITTIIIINIVG